jgi:hypothetical protein
MRTNINLQARESGASMCCVTSRLLLPYTAVGVHSDGIYRFFNSLTGNIPGNWWIRKLRSFHIMYIKEKACQSKHNNVYVILYILYRLTRFIPYILINASGWKTSTFTLWYTVTFITEVKKRWELNYTHMQPPCKSARWEVTTLCWRLQCPHFVPAIKKLF